MSSHIYLILVVLLHIYTDGYMRLYTDGCVRLYTDCCVGSCTNGYVCSCTDGYVCLYTDGHVYVGYKTLMSFGVFLCGNYKSGAQWHRPEGSQS